MMGKVGTSAVTEKLSIVYPPSGATTPLSSAHKRYSRLPFFQLPTEMLAVTTCARLVVVNVDIDGIGIQLPRWPDWLKNALCPGISSPTGFGYFWSQS